MTAADPYALTYTVNHEAWYHTATGDDPGIGIHKSHPDGGVYWEFVVRQVPDIGVKLGVYDDAWAAFRDIPALFARLAGLGGTKPDLDDVKAILDDLGFTDTTERETPASYRIDHRLSLGAVIRATITYPDGGTAKDAVLALQDPEAESSQWRRQGGGWVSTDQLADIEVLYRGNGQEGTR